MGLEERLFRQIDENLYDKNDVLWRYGYLIDYMRSYKSHKLQEELAAALNSSGKYKNIMPEDLEGLHLLHKDYRLNGYESQFGIKPCLFDLGVPARKWNKLKKKLELEKWASACFMSKDNFKEFNHGHLAFNIFGLGIESADYPDSYIFYMSNPSLFYHESLHADKVLYTRNDSKLRSLAKGRIVPAELEAKVGTSILGEIICYICTDMKKANVTEALKGHYLRYYKKKLYKMRKKKHRKIKGEEKAVAERVFASVKEEIKPSVEAAYQLRDSFDLKMFVPLFFALGPTEDEMQNGQLIPPLSDIINLARLMDEGSISREQIAEALEKKNYYA